MTKRAKAYAILKEDPTISAKELAEKAGISFSYANILRTRYAPKRGIVQKHYPLKDIVIKDNVNHPAHYKVGGIETIDFIEAKGLNYNLGNVVKYLTRADHKGNRAEDLAKARWYLNREIAKRTKE